MNANTRLQVVDQNYIARSKRNTLKKTIMSLGIVPENVKRELIDLVEYDSLTETKIDQVISSVRRESGIDLKAIKEEYDNLQSSCTWVKSDKLNFRKKKYLKLFQSMEFKKLLKMKMNSLVAKLGNYSYLCVILLVSSLLGMFWLDTNFGLDFLGGNLYLSIAIGFIAILLIDSISLVIVSALMSALDAIIGDQIKAIRVHSAVILFLAAIATSSFATFVYLRINSFQF